MAGGSGASTSGGPRVIIIKKKSKGHAAHHGGAWKVAYADFVTAMMALFMVMWLLAQTDQETRSELSEYFRTGVFSGAPSVLNGGTGIQNKAFLDTVGDAHTQPEQVAFERISLAVRAQLAKMTSEDPKFKDLASQLKVTVTDDGLLIQILDGGKDLLFDLSSAELKPKLVDILAKIAPLLARLDNQIQVHGHTDARPFPPGSGHSNWELSFDRADRARAVLEKNGLRPDQISGVFAHGSTALFNPKDPLAPENRRLSILAVRRGLEKVASRGQGAAGANKEGAAKAVPAPARPEGTSKVEGASKAEKPE